MARGRWRIDVEAVAAAIALTFGGEDEPTNPYATIYREHSPEEERAEASTGFALLGSYLKHHVS